MCSANHQMYFYAHMFVIDYHNFHVLKTEDDEDVPLPFQSTDMIIFDRRPGGGSHLKYTLKTTWNMR